MKFQAQVFNSRHCPPRVHSLHCLEVHCREGNSEEALYLCVVVDVVRNRTLGVPDAGINSMDLFKTR